MLAEAASMRSPEPAGINGPVESNHGINPASRADSCLVLIVAVAPLSNAVWLVLGKAVVASGDLACEKLLPVHG